MDIAKTEYDFLLGFYLNLSVFDPFTSTFKFISSTERQEILLTISVLQRKLQEVMPKVQDREASARTNKKDESSIVTETHLLNNART
jgi:hypothetical protein